jgi:hypothetical protein
VKNAKPGRKPVKQTDGGGMFLHITPSGSKLWRYQYRYNGKAKLMALGIYPDVSLAEARERHQEARKLSTDGQDPMAKRKAAKQAVDANVITFQSVFKMWLE